MSGNPRKRRGLEGSQEVGGWEVIRHEEGLERERGEKRQNPASLSIDACRWSRKKRRGELGDMMQKFCFTFESYVQVCVC